MTTVTRFLAVLMFSLALGMGGAAFAGPLDDAKAAGYLGEGSNGYLGVLGGAPASAASMAPRQVPGHRRHQRHQPGGRRDAHRPETHRPRQARPHRHERQRPVGAALAQYPHRGALR